MTRGGTITRRPLIVLGWTVVISVAIAAPTVLLRARLPDPMATHWSGARPDGAMTPVWGTAVMILTWLGLTVLFVGMGVAARRLPRRSPAGPRRRVGSGRRAGPGLRGVAGACLGGLGVLLAGAQATTVWANLDRTDWHDASSLGGTFAIPLAGGLVFGCLGLLVDRRTAPPEPEVTEDEQPRLGLAPGERAAWSGRLVSRTMTVLSGGLLAATAVCLILAADGRLPGSVAVVPAVGCLVTSVFTTIRVTADTRGLRVVFGPLGRPVQRVALERITAATVEDLAPLDVGGWGYRGFPGAAAVMLRAGECLVVRYGDGKRLTVSVDGAGDAAAVLNALRTRIPSP